MEYEKAAYGSGKIFAGEILMFFAAILTGASTLVTMFSVSATQVAEEAELTLDGVEHVMDYISQAFEQVSNAIGSSLSYAHAVVVAGIILILSVIIGVIGLILFMVGVGKAAADESLFLRVLYITIGVVVIEELFKVVAPYVFPDIAQTITVILDGLIILLNIYSSFEIIHAFRNISEKIGDEAVIKRGTFTFRVSVVLLVISLIATVIAGFVSEEAANIFTLVALGAQVIWYILYILFIGKARTMLHKYVKADKKPA